MSARRSDLWAPGHPRASRNGYRIVKRAPRTAACGNCARIVNRLEVHATPTLGRACMDCARSEYMYGPPIGSGRETPARWIA